MIYALGAAMTGIGLAGLMVAESRSSTRLMWRTKPLASAGFLVAALGAGAAGSAHGIAILAALLLSFVGDLALVPKGDTAFLVGLSAFLGAHVAYVVAFFLRGVAPGPFAAAVALLAVPGILVLAWLRRHVKPAMAVAVAAYIVALTAMVAAALGSAWQQPSRLLVAGAIAFWLSDLSVARDRLVREAFVNRLWGVPLYYAAQLLLAATVA